MMKQRGIGVPFLLLVFVLTACGGGENTSTDDAEGETPCELLECEDDSTPQSGDADQDEPGDGGEVPSEEPALVLEGDRNRSILEAESLLTFGTFNLASDIAASNAELVLGAGVIADGIQFEIPEKTRSVSVRYRSSGSATFNIHIDDIWVGEQEIFPTGENYELLSFNLQGKGARNVRLSLADDLNVSDSLSGLTPISVLPGIAFDALYLNTYSVASKEYVHYKSLYSREEVFGDSVTFTSDGSVVVSGGQNQSEIVEIKPNLHQVILTGSANLPVGVAHDSLGNFYFTNCLSNSIEKISPNGGQSFFASVTGCPASIVINQNDELLVTSYFGNRIDKVSPSGTVSTLVEDELLLNPVGLTFDENEHLYVANWSGGALFLVNQSATENNSSPTNDVELIKVADLNSRVNQIAYADGFIYAPLQEEHRIVRVSLHGDIETFAGESGLDPVVVIDDLNGPYGIAVSNDKNTLAVIERDEGRVFTLSKDLPITITQQHIDDVYASEKMLGNTVVYNAFEAPQFNSSRTVRVHLPVNYDQEDSQYPVIYLQDGQEVFLENAASVSTSWRVDQTLDEYAWLDLHPGAIVVAIDSSATRAQEYIPYPVSTDEFTISESTSDKLASFIVDTLKPFVDQEYRTKTGREDTHIVGASFGAFFSLYVAFEHPETFGNIGVFSPALWYGLDEIFLNDIRDHDRTLPLRIFIYAGSSDETNATSIYNAFIEHNYGMAELYIDPLGEHNPLTWSHAFWNGMLWLLQDYPNVEPNRLDHPSDWYFTGERTVEGFLTEGSGLQFDSGPITFSFSGEAESVSIIGAWNGWDPAAPDTQMQNNEGVWTTTLDIPPGDWAFGLSVNGQWVNPLWSTVVDQFNPRASDVTPGSFGGFDAVLSVVE